METRLKEIIISVTNRCNLRCKMCQIPQSETEGEMTTAELKSLIEDAVNLGPGSIVFSGGEPFLRGDIFELISFAGQHKINTCLTSNGILIDDDVAKKLSACGVGVVNISLEGPQDIHDSLRGKDSFAMAVKALECLSRYKVETTVATLVCRQNYDALPHAVELAHQLGASTIKFQPFNEIFLIERSAKSKFFASRESFKDIENSIKRIIELTRGYNIATNPVDYLLSIPAYLSGIRQDYSRISCSAIWRSCPISPQGDVYLCWVLSRSPLGNVKKTSLSKIWNSDEHNRLRRSLNKEDCLGCLMSCYDYNFGKYATNSPAIKIEKLKKSKFYKRQYHRVYQYLRYILRKIANHMAAGTRGYLKKERPEITGILNEIAAARDILKRKLANLG